MVDIAWQTPIDVGIHTLGGQIAELGASPARTSPTAVSPASDDYSEPAVFLGRLKSGMAPESRRVVHVFPLVPDLQHSAVVAARCGALLTARDVQWLPRFAGMPCERCVMSP